MRAQGILRIGFVLALGMVAATVGCGDDTASVNPDGGDKAGGTGGSKNDGGSDIKADGGSGGAQGSGGSQGSGGATDAGQGDAVSDDAGDASTGPTVLYDFSSSLAGVNGLPAFALNSGGLASGAVTHDATGGDPDGAMKIFGSYTDHGQIVPAAATFAQLQDWTGKKVHIWFKTTEVLNSSLNYVVALNAMVSDNSYTPIKTKWCNVPGDTDWAECVIDLTAVTGTVSVKQLLLQIQTGAYEPNGLPTGDVTILVDNITLE